MPAMAAGPFTSRRDSERAVRRSRSRPARGTKRSGTAAPWLSGDAPMAALTDSMAISTLPEVRTPRRTLVYWRKEILADLSSWRAAKLPPPRLDS